MLSFLGALALAQSVADPAVAPAAACDEAQGCVRAGPAQLFALADKLYQAGDFSGAAQILQALTQDRNVELRSEARFRLAALLEQMGDLKGAVASLRALLAEQPDANRARLELARLLEKSGDRRAAQQELAKAQAVGLPPEVSVNVRRFASRLAQTNKRRGVTIQATAGPDSNINRATSDQFIDTIIAPFELDPNARRQSGVGATLSAQGFIKNGLGSVDLLSRGSARADLTSVADFNDIQLSADSGPEFTLGKARIRPSALIERRWFGGDLYSSGVGADLNLMVPLSGRSQVEFNASRVRQNIRTNDGQDGWRTSGTADFYHSLGKGTTVRATVRYGRIDARLRPESLRQLGGGLLLAHETPAATFFGEADYTRTHGVEPLFLFGKTRRDQRWDLVAGAIFKSRKFGGLLPLVRVTHSDSSANIVLYDYRRTRLDVGFTRTF